MLVRALVFPLILVVAGPVVAGPAVAQEPYPTRPITIVNPFPPGGIGIPPHVLATLREATRKAVQDPEFQAAMDKVKTPIAYQDHDEFTAWWERDARTLAEVIRQVGKIETK